MSTETTQLSADMAVEAVNDVLGNKRARWEPVDAETPLRSLKLDSLEVAELFATLEDRSGLDLDPESARDLTVVGDLANLRTL